MAKLPWYMKSRGTTIEFHWLWVLLQKLDAGGRSEQLSCPRCGSTNILNPDKDNDAQCIECAFIWSGTT